MICLMFGRACRRSECSSDFRDSEQFRDLIAREYQKVVRVGPPSRHSGVLIDRSTQEMTHASISTSVRARRRSTLPPVSFVVGTRNSGPSCWGPISSAASLTPDLSRRYSDVDMALVTAAGLSSQALDQMRAAAVGLSADWGPRLSVFWTDRHCLSAVSRRLIAWITSITRLR